MKLLLVLIVQLKGDFFNDLKKRLFYVLIFLRIVKINFTFVIETTVHMKSPFQFFIVNPILLDLAILSRLRL